MWKKRSFWEFYDYNRYGSVITEQYSYPALCIIVLKLYNIERTTCSIIQLSIPSAASRTRNEAGFNDFSPFG